MFRKWQAAVGFSLLTAGASGTLPHDRTLSQGLDSPSRLAVSESDVLVADARAGRVERLAWDGTTLNVWNVPEGPVGVARHPDGRVFVSRRDDARVAVHAADFTFLRFLGNGIPALNQPTDLAVDPTTGRLYVVDSGADRFLVFDSSESLVLLVGARGTAASQFKHPSGIAVDAAHDRVFVADQDNFRVQVFTRGGVFVTRFGYRIKYLPGGGSEAWLARVAGLDVDGSGRVYVTDALMGTVRLFTPTGAEIEKLVGYGYGPGELRNPCDIALSLSGRVAVANGAAGTIETFQPLGQVVAGMEGVEYAGSNEVEWDAREWFRRAKPTGARLFGGARATVPYDLALVIASAWDAPHTLADTGCNRCHGMDGQPGGIESSVDGQSNLCLSCHTSGGHAPRSALRPADREDETATPTTGGRSHAWGVPAINAAVGSDGPPPGTEMARYVANGSIKCATCHNQHTHSSGRPYLRMNNNDGALCKACHTDHLGHTPSGSWQPTCAECHDMHNPQSGNQSLVRTSILNRTLGAAKAVVFTAQTGPNSFDDGDPAANDGICQVCHTATSYHRHDGTGAAHNAGVRCTSCHPHDAGFMPAGGDCLSCHASAQDNGDGIPAGGRRAIVGEFPVGDAHAHYGVTLDSSACVVCHDQTTHMDGYVDLMDADGARVYRFQRVADLMHDPDASTFCASCHDANGAARLPMPLDPFGSGNRPADVASRFLGTLRWDELYGDFCFAPEGMLRGVNSHHDVTDADQSFSGAKLECLNCHGAHTSSAARPTADPWSPTSPWTGTGDGFCLRCHSGGTGPLDPGFPPGVRAPVIDPADPRWTTLGFDWNVILGGACRTSDCSSLRGIDSCDYTEGPWYVDYSWTHSAHGPDSKRAWPGYSGAPGASMKCMDCHDPHGSYSAQNSAGNPYMIRDDLDGSVFVDDGTRTGGVNGPPWNTFGSTRAVRVSVSGQTVDWGGPNSFCSACHATWSAAYDFHSFCTGCQTCHGHGMAFGEADFVGFDDDTPCPIPLQATADTEEDIERRVRAAFENGRLRGSPPHRHVDPGR